MLRRDIVRVVHRRTRGTRIHDGVGGTQGRIQRKNESLIREMRRLRNASSPCLLLLLMLLLLRKMQSDLSGLLSVMCLSQFFKMLCPLEMFLCLTKILLDVLGGLRGLLGI
jgi:hypothetical protein